MAVPWGNKHPLTIYQQGGFEETFELYDALPNGDPDFDNPVNFVDDTTAIAQCRANEHQDSDLLAEFAVEIVENKLILKLTSDETLAMDAGYGYYDIFVTEPDSEPQMFMEGKVTINRAVTVKPEIEEP